jgi:hypothetical protein
LPAPTSSADDTCAVGRGKAGALRALGRHEQTTGDDVGATDLQIVQQLAELGMDELDLAEAGPFGQHAQHFRRLAGDAAARVDVGERWLDRIQRTQRRHVASAR